MKWSKPAARSTSRGRGTAKQELPELPCTRRRRWPARTRPVHVGARLTRDQLIDQISNGTPGGGNMPAYGKQINPAEMTALVAFLVSLRPPASPCRARP